MRHCMCVYNFRNSFDFNKFPFKKEFNSIPAEHTWMPNPSSNNNQSWAVFMDPIF